jgi:hypothetical protein
MITHVAIKFNGITYCLLAPKRHHHVIRYIVETTGVSHVDNDEQGFMDDQGNFLNRVQALEHALACNQVKDPNDIRCGMLFSEDVW